MHSRLKTIAQRAYSSLETLQASYDIARMAIQNGVPGDFVECGVAAGAQAAAMALAIIEYDVLSDRRVHLFDSFSGIPQCGEHDTEYLAAGHQAGLTACSVEQVRGHMEEWGIDPALLVYHEGYFWKTISPPADPPLDIEQIAVLRLDSDLYESTKVCLEHLYPLVSRGGWVIVDDWDLSGARKAVIEHVGHGFGPAYWIKH